MWKNPHRVWKNRKLPKLLPDVNEIPVLCCRPARRLHAVCRLLQTPACAESKDGDLYLCNSNQAHTGPMNRSDTHRLRQFWFVLVDPRMAAVRRIHRRQAIEAKPVQTKPYGRRQGETVLPGSGATSDKDALIAHTIDTRRKPQRTAGLSALQANPRRGLSAGTASCPELIRAVLHVATLQPPVPSALQM